MDVNQKAVKVFSVNGTMNRIIKSTVELLLRSDISKARKKELRKLMVYFGDVESIDLYTVNLYQIFTYVKNKEIELSAQPHEVSGMLLYAKTDEAVLPNNSYKMSGNIISVKTLDLDCDFSEIANQLNKIVESHFGIEARC